MKWRNIKQVGLIVLLCLLAACGLRTSLEKKDQALFHGVTYVRDVRTSPRRMVIHVVKVDLRSEGIGILVTPGDPKQPLPLKAMTTSQFLRQYELQVAINGDGFTPWHSNTILDYYPHTGDKVAPVGFAASRGVEYSQDTDEEPTIYFSRTNQAQFNAKIGNLYNAISGTDMLLRSGQELSGLESEPEPRTAVALDRSNRTLILIVVDGRQKGYSEGVTLAELAKIAGEYGGHNAMNLDGGGSTTLVTKGKNGEPEVLNSPINNDIPGRERVVGNHLGIFAVDKENDNRGENRKTNTKSPVEKNEK